MGHTAARVASSAACSDRLTGPRLLPRWRDAETDGLGEA